MYRGWGCFLTTVVLGLICMILIIGIGGPAYNDCDNQDCSTQKSYGLYCEDYCWSGHSGPGSGLVLVVLFALIAALLVPYCSDRRFHNRRHRVFDEPYYYNEPYQVINVN